MAKMRPTKKARRATATSLTGSLILAIGQQVDVTRTMKRQWHSMWTELKDCLDFRRHENFGTSGRQRLSMYQQLVCHAVWAVHPEIGGDTWDLEAEHPPVKWDKIFNPVAVYRHQCLNK